jgi:hypothetical protein
MKAQMDHRNISHSGLDYPGKNNISDTAVSMAHRRPPKVAGEGGSSGRKPAGI